MMIEKMKKYKLIIFVLIMNIILWPYNQELAMKSILNSAYFLREVFYILPPIMILMGLLDVWVPKVIIEAHLGKESGIKGQILSILLGTAAAGPLFAAFPIALSLKKKGVRIANVVIFLGSWATIKIPMILMESNFINLKFALLRFAITVPFILLMGMLMEKLNVDN